MSDLPKTAAEARLVGSKKFFTGKPCKYGHVADRRTATSVCVECTRAASDAWKSLQPKEKFQAYTQKYRSANKEKVHARDRETKRRLREADPEGVKAIKRAYYAKQVAAEGRVLRPRWETLSQEVVFARSTAVHKGVYSYVHGSYVSMHQDMRIICASHGEFLQTASNHLKGAGCPRCSIHASQGESGIADWLEGLGVVVERRSRKIIPPKEVDVWLPKQRLGIEYHGLYWHTEDRVANLHREKWELAQQQGVRLIQVFEDEWLNKPDIVLSRLLALTGRGEKYAARKCQIIELVAAEARAFLTRQHLQGFGSSGKLYLGLEHEGQLVAAATFGQRNAAKMSGSKEWEVLRYASMGQVIGGFGRLFSEFLRRVSPERVVSYCDLRWGDGRMYRATGFTLERVTEPDYWWLPSSTARERIPRYVTQKHKLKTHPVLSAHYREDWSEDQICFTAGWRKVLGVGNQRWLWKNPLDTTKP